MLSNSRRNFITKLATATTALPFLAAVNPAFAAEAGRVKSLFENSLPTDFVTDEDLWSWVREAYTVSPNIINLNNGGVAPQPKVVQDAHIRYYQYCNEAPSYYMWQILDQGREPLRERLSTFMRMRYGGSGHQ